MTYGKTAASLRRELIELLEEADVPRARARRPLSAEESQLLQGYRSSVLNWINTSTQLIVPDVAPHDWQWGPARHFANHLNRITVVTKGADTAGVRRRARDPAAFGHARTVAPSSRQRDARAASRTRHPRGTDRAEARESRAMPGPSAYSDALRIVDDNAAMANAIILLDVRVAGRPNWHHLGGNATVDLTTPGQRRRTAQRDQPVSTLGECTHLDRRHRRARVPASAGNRSGTHPTWDAGLPRRAQQHAHPARGPAPR